MAKREWGAKHTCAACGVKFYDLHRRPIACPRCGSVIEVERVRPNRRRPPAAEPAPAVSEDTAAAEAEDESADEDDDGLVEDIDGDDASLVANLGEAESSRPSK